MKTRIHLLALLVLLTLNACLETSSDEDNNPTQTCNLLSSTTTITDSHGSSHSYTLNYSYNTEGQLITIQSPDTTAINIKFGYDSQKRLVTEHMGAYSWSSEYNTQGQLAKQVRTFEFAPGRFETYFLLHYFDDAGTLEKSEYYADEPTGDILLYTYNFTYQMGELAGVEKVSEQDTRYYAATIALDKQKPALPKMPMHMLYMFRDETLPVMGLLPGNIANYSVQYGEGESGFKSFTATYSYNASGYPATVERNYANGAKEVTSYTYKCR